MSGLGALFSVMMIGHSLFGQTAPDMLQEALRAGQGQGNVAAQIINGAPLRYNWEESHTAEGVDARAMLPDGRTTHMILTEAIPLANHTQWSDTEVYAQAFFGLAVAANPEVKVYLQETWHSLKSGTGETVENDEGAGTPWRQRLDDDLPAWEGIVTAVAAGNTSDTASVTLIPAGQAMARLYDEIEADLVPGLDDIAQVFSDDIHLNDTGHYFVTMVQYAALTGQSPLGLPTDFNDRWGKAFDTPEGDLARELQRVAFAAVQSYQGADVVPVPPPKPAPTPVPAQAQQQAAPIVATGTPVDTTPPKDAVPGSRDVAVGLAPIADWSVQQPFIDLMKTSRPWLGHLPGQFGGMDYDVLLAGGYLDAAGWPVKMPPELGSIGTLILTDMPEAAVGLEGRYLLRFDGAGVIEVTGRATRVRYGKGEVSFDYVPGPGSVDIRIQRVNVTDPPRNITVMRADHAKRFADGALFNPAWTSRIGQFDALRFMDWMATNDSSVSSWDDRPQLDDVTYARRGVPVEVLVALANELEIAPWFNMPHLGDDAYVRAFATQVAEQLDPALPAYVEFSNEVWNWQFTQTHWADEMAQARWEEKDKGMQFYGMRAAEVARIWTEVFGDAANARLVNVISTQTGWLGLETESLNAPLYIGEAPGNAAPATAFDAYAVSGYFGGVLGLEDRKPLVDGWLSGSATAARAKGEADGLSGAALDRFSEDHKYDAATALAAQELRDGSVSGNAEDTLSDLIGRVWPYHAAVARAHGLDLVMYEGGSHVVGLGAQVEDAALTGFFHHLNYTAEMGALYHTLLTGWQAVGGQMFNAYSDVYAPTKWGSWGALRHLDDANPRWDALVTWQ
tara:strand:+ start:34869 stop:37412 length:2544 start_codon:yes stop_codon:yes gene_type:complete